ncbi:MAG: S-adenosyl-l-methionine hydroxide adenosyltransferase family protein, partial [Cyanobacteria bacterium]|nr:S-adenosyl-l-methionine hydroxide adenosyltransferase family protein [Cyanobacteriota bacterium]MDW8202122.1 SAM-dependent chlorinase/fluorinase [Cyanobacteriota bacterium SKYGB_h_bin112]
MMPLITLLTDFGDRDAYVGIMKGVIASINPAITTIDLSHQIPPQDIASARFNLMNAVPYFPAGTVHLAVVDPGVGHTRRAIALRIAPGFLVGPDNGIFSGVLRRYPALLGVELTNHRSWSTSRPSATFHGRDIFAPAAAYLATGVELERLGTLIDTTTLVELAIPAPIQTTAGIRGAIQYCDRFGNLVTNIPGKWVGSRNWFVNLGSLRIPGRRTYGSVEKGKPVALIGSHGWIEIAINCGHAQSQLQLKVTDPV